MTTNSNYLHLQDKCFFPNNEELVGAAGSIDNDNIKYCKFCATNGFRHEPIIFRKVIVEKWVVFDYFKPWHKHEHKQIQRSEMQGT